MSGGVDSSVAALLLKEHGYNVVGAHMKLWDYAEVGADVYRDGRCCSLDAVNDCRAVCDAIDAPFYVLNLSRQFRREVIDNFVSEYKAGRTPNPCIRCNTNVKWQPFLQKAREIGCDFIATGHYARIELGDTGRNLICKGVDETRDQSYFLWGLTQDALSRTLMPLGGLHKSEVREIARRHGLKTSEKKESREICFVADDDYHRFLREWDAKHDVPARPGDIVEESGRVMGRHDGAAYYTIGQRHGLGISHPTPLYVLDIDAANNRVVVGDDASLYRDEMVVENVNWIATAPPSRLPRRSDTSVSSPRHDASKLVSRASRDDEKAESRAGLPETCRSDDFRHPGPTNTPHLEPDYPCHPERSRRQACSSRYARGSLEATVKIRYQHSPANARLTVLTDNSVRVTFDERQRAITPGQSAVFYDDDILLGGGVIK